MKEILKAAKNNIIKDEEVERLAKERLKICSVCEFNSKTAVPFCRSCGCPLFMRVRGEVSCPEGKW